MRFDLQRQLESWRYRQRVPLIGAKSERKCNRVTNLPQLHAGFQNSSRLPSEQERLLHDYTRDGADPYPITPRCPSNDRNGGRALRRCRSYFCRNPTNADIAQQIGKKLCIS